MSYYFVISVGYKEHSVERYTEEELRAKIEIADEDDQELIHAAMRALENDYEHPLQTAYEEDACLFVIRGDWCGEDDPLIGLAFSKAREMVKAEQDVELAAKREAERKEYERLKRQFEDGPFVSAEVGRHGAHGVVDDESGEMLKAKIKDDCRFAYHAAGWQFSVPHYPGRE